MKQELINLWSKFLCKFGFTYEVRVHNGINYINLHFNYSRDYEIAPIALIEKEDKNAFTDIDNPLLILSDKLNLVSDAHWLYTNGNNVSFISIGLYEHAKREIKPSHVFVTYHNDKPGITFEYANGIYYYSYCNCSHEWKKHRDNIIVNNAYIDLFALE